jgi:hypothetical protein
MGDDERYVCQPCGREVRPDDPDVVACAEQIRADGMHTGKMFVDGMRALFHEGCAPRSSDPRWRHVPRD